MKEWRPVNLVIGIILIVLAILLFIKGGIDIKHAEDMGPSGELGAYALWAGGMIQHGVGIVFVIAASVVLTRGKKK